MRMLHCPTNHITYTLLSRGAPVLIENDAVARVMCFIKHMQRDARLLLHEFESEAACKVLLHSCCVTLFEAVAVQPP